VAGERPNVLFIMADQHNARRLGCAGDPDVQTPALDRLAAEGVRCTNAYANNPICTPSRLSFLTGQYPSAHGYYGLYGREPASPLYSLMRHFREAGYRTGAVGKLHTPRFWLERDLQFVYDEFVDFPKYLDAVGLYERNDNRAFVPGAEGEGQTSLLPVEHCCERVAAAQALRFIRNEGEPRDRGAADAPWLLWLTFSRPHQPYTPSEPFASLYDPARLTLPERGAYPCADEAQLRRIVARYLGLVAQVDDAIGRVLAELAARGELERTIVVYTSDHGDYAGQYGRYEKKGGLSFSAICRIPFLVRFPAGLPQGVVTDALIEAVDLFPTLCVLAGLPVPNTVQGRPSAALTGRGAPRDSALTENRWRKALQTARYRYVANLPGQGERDELYDGQRDPLELHNVVDEPAYAPVGADLQRLLLDRVVRAAHPTTVMGGGWHDHHYDLDGRADLSQPRRVSPYD
jgi:arylsulfatase